MDRASVIKTDFSGDPTRHGDNKFLPPAIPSAPQTRKSDTYKPETIEKLERDEESSETMLLSREKVYDEVQKFGDILLLGRDVSRFEFTMWYWAVRCKWVYHGSFRESWPSKINHDHYFYNLCKKEIDSLMEKHHEWWEKAFKSRVHKPQSLAHQFRRAARRLEKGRARRVVAAYMKVCNAIVDPKMETNSINDLKEDAKETLRICIDEDMKDTEHVQTNAVKKLFLYILERESILNALHHSMLSLGEDIYTLEWCTNWMNFRMWFEEKGPGALLFPKRGQLKCRYRTWQPSAFKEQRFRPASKNTEKCEEVVLDSIFGKYDQNVMNSCLTFVDWGYLILLQWRVGDVDAISKEDPRVSKIIFEKLGDDAEESMMKFEADVEIIHKLAERDEQRYQENVRKARENWQEEHPKFNLSLQERLKLNFGARQANPRQSGKSDVREEANDWDTDYDNENIWTGGRRALAQLGLHTRSKQKKTKNGKVIKMTEVLCTVCGEWHGLSDGSCEKAREMSRTQYINSEIDKSNKTDEEKEQLKKLAKQGKKAIDLLALSGFLPSYGVRKTLKEMNQNIRVAIEQGYIVNERVDGSLWKMVSTEQIEKHYDIQNVEGWTQIMGINPEDGKEGSWKDLLKEKEDTTSTSQSSTNQDPLLDMKSLKMHLLKFLFEKGLLRRIDESDKKKQQELHKKDDLLERSFVVDIIKQEVGKLDIGDVIDLGNTFEFVKEPLERLNTMHLLVKMGLPKPNVEGINGDEKGTIESTIELILGNTSFKKRNVLLMPVADFREFSELKQWRDCYYKGVFGARITALKAYGIKSDAEPPQPYLTRYDEILQRDLQKQDSEFGQKLKMAKEPYARFIQQMFDVPHLKKPSEKVQGWLKTSTTRRYGFFFEQFEREVKNHVQKTTSDREKTLKYVCLYTLACIRRQYITNLQYQEGKASVTNSTGAIVAHNFDETEEVFDEITNQQEFGNYRHTMLLYGSRQWELDVVAFLNRMAWKLSGTMDPGDLQGDETIINKFIEEIENRKKEIKEEFGDNSISACLRCGIINTYNELNKMRDLIKKTRDSNYGHLPHCPEVIRKWFSVLEAEDPVVIEKIVSYVRNNWKFLHGKMRHVGSLCALQLVNIVYQELNEELTPSDEKQNAAKRNRELKNSIRRNIEAKHFWGVETGIEDIFVKVKGFEGSTSEDALKARNQLGFIDWVQDMENLLEHTLYFYELDKLSNKKEQRSLEENENIEDLLRKIRNFFVKEGETISYVKLIEQDGESKIFDFLSRKFETKTVQGQYIEILSRESFWKFMQRVYNAAVAGGGTDEIKALMNFEHERYKLKPMSYIDLKGFVELKKKHQQSLSESEQELEKAPGPHVRYLGVKGSFELHSMLGATLMKCQSEMDVYVSDDEKELSQACIEYIGNVHEVVSSSLEGMKESDKASLLPQTLKKMGIFEEQRNFSEVCTGISEWLTNLRRLRVSKIPFLGRLALLTPASKQKKIFFNEISKGEDVVAMLTRGIGSCYLIWLQTQKMYVSKEERDRLGKMIDSTSVGVRNIQTQLNSEQMAVIRVWSDIIRGYSGFAMDFSTWDSVRRWLETQKNRLASMETITSTELLQEEYQFGNCFRDNVMSILPGNAGVALDESKEETVASIYRLALGMTSEYCKISM